MADTHCSLANHSVNLGNNTIGFAQAGIKGGLPALLGRRILNVWMFA